MNKNKKFCIIVFLTSIIILLGIAITTYVVDPFFHYHKPYNWISYNLNYQRYQNDGILKHFDYDAIITGSSMTENFRTTEFDDIFNVNSIKVPFSGASFREINENLQRATSSNDNIKIIICSLDLGHLFDNYDKLRYEDDTYPWYLYDKYLYNDVNYIFNKSVLFSYTLPTIEKTLKKEESTTFNDYSKWYDRKKFGKEYVDSEYNRSKKNNNESSITDEDRKNTYQNFTINIIQIAKDNPDIDFYLFYPPYSIYYWDDKNQRGALNREIDGLEYATSLLVEVDNIHLYSFISELDIIYNLDNYKDTTHYNEKINTQMLIWMKEGHDLLTKDNYKKYFDNYRKIMNNYDFDKLFE